MRAGSSIRSSAMPAAAPRRRRRCRRSVRTSRRSACISIRARNSRPDTATSLHRRARLVEPFAAHRLSHHAGQARRQSRGELHAVRFGLAAAGRQCHRPAGRFCSELPDGYPVWTTRPAPSTGFPIPLPEETRIVRAFLGALWRGLDGLRKFLHLLLLLLLFGSSSARCARRFRCCRRRSALVIRLEGRIVEQLTGDPFERALRSAGQPAQRVARLGPDRCHRCGARRRPDPGAGARSRPLSREPGSRPCRS